MSSVPVAKTDPALRPAAMARRTFVSISAHRNYRLFFLGQSVSLGGSWVQRVAQVWLVLSLTHSAKALGVLAACQWGPYTVLGLCGGALADRLDHRRTLLATQAAFMACAALLAALVAGGIARLWEVDVLALTQGLVLVLDTPVRQAFTIQMVGPAELPNAVALNSTLLNISRTAGPALGGLLIATAGVGACFTVNAVSFLPLLAGLLAMRTEDLHRPPPRAEAGSLARETMEAVRLAIRDARIRLALVMVFVVATLGTSFDVVLPLLARDTLHGNSEVLGLLFASFGGGALAGALVSAARGRASWRMLLGSAGALGLLELGVAPQRWLAGCAVTLALVGIAFSLFATNANALLQLEVPDGIRGRMLALYGYAWVGTSALSGLVAAAISAHGGPGLMLATGGVAIAGSAAVATVFRRRASPGPTPLPGFGDVIVRGPPVRNEP